MPFALRIAHSVIGNPVERRFKIDIGYNSKTVWSRSPKFFELISCYISIMSDMAKHVDHLADVMKEMRGISTKFENDLAIGILWDKELNRENMYSRLIEDMRTIRNSAYARGRLLGAFRKCEICKKGHDKEN